MVTTRSSTGALPKYKKQKISNIDRPEDRNAHLNYVRDEKAVIGDKDKMSRLPFEVLMTIFSHAHPQTLAEREYRSSRSALFQ